MPEGLLDFIKTPEGIGLLSTAFGGFAGARRGQPLNSLGRAGLAGITGYNTALDLRSNLANNEMHRALYGAQIGNYNSEVEQRKAALEKERQKQEALRAFLTPKPDIPKPQPDGDAYVPNQMGFTDGTLPIPDGNGVTVTDLPPDRVLDSSQSINKYPVLSYQPQILNNRPNEVKPPTAINQQIDYNVLLRAGYSPEEVQKIAGIQNIGLPEVARVEETTDDQGRPVRVQLDKYGRVVGSSMSQWKQDVLVDQGNQKTFVNPVTQQVGRSFTVNPSNELTGNQKDYNYGKTDPDYAAWLLNKTKLGATNVSNKIDVKTGESLGKEVGPMVAASKAAAEGALSQMETVNRLNSAINSGKLISGPFANQRITASQVAEVLGIGGRDNAEILTNTRDAIQSLAKFSLDGRSALKGQGQISDYEGKLLAKATSGDISDLTIPELKVLTATAERVSKAQLGIHKRNMTVMRSKPDLKDIADFYDVPDYQQTQPPTGQTPNAKPLPKPMKGMTRNGYKFKGGDPADQNNWEKQ